MLGGRNVRPHRYGALVRTAAALVVHPQIHREEIDRFRSYIVAGPDQFDCDIWVGAVGGDGYGRFRINRDGYVLSVRPNRYALAMAGGRLAAGVLALHQCDNPICVRADGTLLDHLEGSTQAANLARISQHGRRGVLGYRGRMRGREAMYRRSLALRAAVIDGWDEERIARALASLDEGQPVLF